MRLFELASDDIKKLALEKGLSTIVATRAQKLYDKVAGNPYSVGDTDIVNGYWIETHTYGCRNDADQPEEEWIDQHWKIYDEYKNDGISVVLGDPSDGVFVTITPQN